MSKKFVDDDRLYSWPHFISYQILEKYFQSNMTPETSPIRFVINAPLYEHPVDCIILPGKWATQQLGNRICIFFTIISTRTNPSNGLFNISGGLRYQRHVMANMTQLLKCESLHNTKLNINRSDHQPDLDSFWNVQQRSHWWLVVKKNTISENPERIRTFTTGHHIYSAV